MDGDQKRSPSLASGVLYRDAPCGLVEASVDGNILHCNEAFAAAVAARPRHSFSFSKSCNTSSGFQSFPR